MDAEVIVIWITYKQTLEEQAKLAEAKFGKLKKKKPSVKQKKQFDSGEYYLQQAKEKEAKEKAEAEKEGQEEPLTNP